VSGATFKLLRALNLLEDRTIPFSREDSFELVRNKALEMMKKQNKKNERQYNMCSRPVSYEEGQEIYIRNFKQSNFQAGLLRPGRCAGPICGKISCEGHLTIAYSQQ